MQYVPSTSERVVLDFLFRDGPVSCCKGKKKGRKIVKNNERMSEVTMRLDLGELVEKILPLYSLYLTFVQMTGSL